MTTSALTLAITGASGAQYGLRLLEQLVKTQKPIYVLISTAARKVIPLETELRLPAQTHHIQSVLTEYYQAMPGQIQVFAQQQWFAPVASGSAAPRAMVVCPCTSGTLAAIAQGLSRTLIERAADVVLKERRKLILVHRETPLSRIHLENMLRLTQMGATILPANPGFYHHPQGIEDLIDFIVARILDHLEINHNLLPRWGEQNDD